MANLMGMEESLKVTEVYILEESRKIIKKVTGKWSMQTEKLKKALGK